MAVGLKATFLKLDVDGSGCLQFEEFAGLINDLQLSYGVKEVNEQNVKDIFDQLDKDSSGSVDYNELVNFLFSDEPEEIRDLTEKEKADIIAKDLVATEAIVGKELAPHLAEYFQKMGDMTDGGMQTVITTTDNTNVALQDHQDSQWISLKEVLEKSFKRHDANCTNILERDEAVIFFSNLVRVASEWARAFMVYGVEQVISQQLQEFALMGTKAERKKKVINLAKEPLRKLVDGITAKSKAIIDEYEIAKEAKNAALFKIFDTKGDGTIQLTEFIDAMNPNGGKHEAVMQAAGIDPLKLEPDEQSLMKLLKAIDTKNV